MSKLKDLKLKSKYKGFLEEVLNLAYHKYKMPDTGAFQNEILCILKHIDDYQKYMELQGAKQ